MEYSCQEKDVCGVQGQQNYACRRGQNCTRLWFPEKGHNKFFCENSKPIVHWTKIEVLTQY